MKIGFIGCGNMGGALAKACSACKGTELYLSDISAERAGALALELSASASTSKEIAKECDIVFLAVKPNIIPAVCEEIKGELSRSTLVVSMAAGIKLSDIAAALPDGQPIIRIMPNTPAAVGKGMITWCKNERVSDAQAFKFALALSKAGKLDLIPEELIEAATAVAGCGPAFVYMFANALAEGGAACGLPREKALAYAIETIIGAGEMMKATGKDPEELKDAVCSPGGSTIEGVYALESGGFRSVSESAVIAAFEKTKLLGKK